MPVVSTMTRDISSNIAVLKTAADEVDTQLQNDRQYSDLGPQLGVGANGMTYLGAIQKSISSRIAEFGRYGGRGFITNPLNLTEWNLTMFPIIFYKVSSLDNLRQRQKRPEKRFSLSTVGGF